MDKKIAKNLMYNVLLQIVTLFLPLITTPYVSRVLGREGIGVYSYTLSIVQYFIILGTLGISTYGNRAIAYVRDDKKKMSNTFWAICILRFTTTGIALVIFILVFGFKREYSHIYIIQSINVLAAMLDISWLYMGLEEFKKTVTRNLLVKIVGVIFIFIFINERSDLNKYVIINALMVFLGNVVMWVYVPKTVTLEKITFKDIKRHIIPAIKLFIPQIAIQVYAILDKTMLGTLSNTGEVGIYEQSQKIVKLVLGLVTSLGVVMLPRMSNIFAKGNTKKMNEYLNNSLKGVAYISIPMAIGLASISNEFVPWFFGEEFCEVSLLMTILTPILFLIAISNVLGTQYLLPSNRTKEFTASVTVGAMINVILNLLLIPKYKAVGACISTVLAEFGVTSLQYIFLRKNIYEKSILKEITKYILASCLMFMIVRLVGNIMGIGVLTTLTQSVVGICVYGITLSILKSEINTLIQGTIIVKCKIITKRLD